MVSKIGFAGRILQEGQEPKVVKKAILENYPEAKRLNTVANVNPLDILEKKGPLGTTKSFLVLEKTDGRALTCLPIKTVKEGDYICSYEFVGNRDAKDYTVRKTLNVEG